MNKINLISKRLYLQKTMGVVDGWDDGFDITDEDIAMAFESIEKVIDDTKISSNVANVDIREPDGGVVDDEDSSEDFEDENELRKVLVKNSRIK